MYSGDLKQDVSVTSEFRQISEFETASFFESIPGMYLIVDTEHRILAATDAALRATMSTRSETVGRALNDADVRGAVERSMQTLQPAATDTQQGENEPFTWRAVCSPVQSSDGTISHVVIEIQDTTETEELRDTVVQLRSASEAKETYLCRMSHELRSPLTAVIGYSELLQADAGLAGEDLQAAEAILNAGEHLMELTNDLLDITRIESGQLKMSIEPVRLESAVLSAVELMTPLATRTGVTISLPEHSSSLFVRADLRRLTQAVVNLLSNAIKYNRPNGRVWIDVTKSPSSGRVRLSVGDTGMGIDEADLTRLFQPFERLGAESTDVNGAGLGLALTRSLVEEMGGTIDVESEVGRGTTFSIELTEVLTEFARQ
jgi:signal transduction histidine kinase